MTSHLKIILLVSFITSCSTLKKTIIYSSLAGGMAGATSGVLLSPDKENRGANAAVFGLIGAGVAALAGYALYQEDPRNQKLKPMLDMDLDNPNKVDLDLDGLNIEANLSQSDKYMSPKMDLPKELEGKIKKQYLIKYQSKERYINKGAKTYYIPPFQIYEHAYDQ